jgi:hypothetical protein
MPNSHVTYTATPDYPRPPLPCVLTRSGLLASVNGGIPFGWSVVVRGVGAEAAARGLVAKGYKSVEARPHDD